MNHNEMLYLVMPVYNEEASVEKVVVEWGELLREMGIKFVLLAVNDGSNDRTAAVLDNLIKQYPELRIHSKKNTGHGQSCIAGYKIAIDEGADWIFQIDSDGQCDPTHFEEVWKNRSSSQPVFGYRVSRDDGQFRMFALRIVTLVTFFATKVWVADANVPYRLFHRAQMQKIVPLIPPTIYLANILVSVYAKSFFGISWVNIHFRDRFGGSPSVKPGSFYNQGVRLFRELSESYKEAV